MQPCPLVPPLRRCPPPPPAPPASLPRLQVPMDQGLHGLDMITRFTRNMSLAHDDDDSDKLAAAGTAAAQEQPGSSAAGEVEAAPMKRGVGEQAILAGATWQIRRVQPGGHTEQ